MSTVTSMGGPTSHPPSRTSTVGYTSIPSVNSGATRISGPSNKEPAQVTSQWRIGWQTPTLMLASYLLALTVGIGHFAFFDYINGKEADGPHQIVPQSYVTTISNILANVFGYSLRGALSIAFVQHLWLILRLEAMKVSTIELLFSIRSNPFVLLRPAALRATPVLFVLAILVWTTQIVVSFPPGAITVVSRPKITFDIVPVPTFNASFMGNASGVEASAYSLNTLNPDPPGGFTTLGLDGNKNGNLIPRLAAQVLTSGEALTLPSPCGVNCSYTVQFEGPYFNCDHTSTNFFYNNSAKVIAIYNGSWFDPRSAFDVNSLYNGTFTIAYFNSSTYTPLSADADAFGFREVNNGSIFMQQDKLTCVPGRASFTVNHTYVNNIQSRTIAATPIEPLINLAPLTHDSIVEVPGFLLNNTLALGTAPANWSEYALSWYRDNNIMTIFDALMDQLQGSFVAELEDPASFDPNAPTNTSTWFENPVWDASVTTTMTGGTYSNAAQNDTIIDSTRFNQAFNKFSAFEPAHPAFNISQDMLNDYLFNMTTSLMVAYGTWQTTANATITTRINVYSFSLPLNLFLPYFVSLGLALPFIVLGCAALYRNGVSAMDSSFTQIIITTTGSAALDKAAAGGCLGGNENLPQELKDLKIRFGEFIGRDEPGRVRRAGFGVESEVVPLNKGADYGIARWI